MRHLDLMKLMEGLTFSAEKAMCRLELFTTWRATMVTQVSVMKSTTIIVIPRVSQLF